MVTRCDSCYHSMLFGFCLQCHVKKVTCPECSRSLPSLETFRKHFKEHSLSKNTVAECWVELHRKRKPRRLFVCVRCSYYVCEKFSDLMKHERIVHQVGKQFSCSHCDRQYATKASLNVHIRIHADEPSFECEFCNKKFFTKYRIKHHEQTCHKSDTSYTCDYCKKQFKSSYLVGRHMNQHSAEKLYACDSCDKSFLFHFALKKHQLTHAKSNAVFECDYCGKKYRWKSDLSRHICRNHLEILPYTCSVCQKKFSRQCYLVQHKASHGQAKAYLCFCGKTFRYQSNLTRHRKVHKNMKSAVKL